MSSQPKYTNYLINETSPYLLQHAHNPVNWHAWGESALAKSKNENKLLLISIGYSACHWCHVMEHESFEDEQVAARMNDHFICIKVDREERPDIDQIYMDAVQMLTGSGGWPLNCFALPDGRPVFGGTYFPKENWMEVLDGIFKVYKNEKEKVIEQAISITQGIGDISPLLNLREKSVLSPGDMEEYYQELSKSFDMEWGGSKGAPKFPMPGNYLFLLRYHYHFKSQVAFGHLKLTLYKMALGGIFDQLGGGFARYSTDGNWKVPHFEKMLYDNAQLVSLYSLAYKVTRDENYKVVVEETLRFVEGELLDTNGGFYSALDADSEGEEGKYYVWTKNEIISILGKDSDWFCQTFRVTEEGNWEHGNNVLFPEHFPERTEKLISSKQRLKEQRNKRINPGLDNKILCSWNALMVLGYLEAYEAFNNNSYLLTAGKAALFLEKNHLQADGSLFRVSTKTKKIEGFLDDYSYTSLAFLRLYEVSGDEKWLKLSEKLVNYVVNNFYDQQTGLFYYTATSDNFARKHEVHDNVTPSSNAVMANVLLRLGTLLESKSYKEMAKSMVQSMTASIKKYPGYHAHWAEVMSMLAFPVVEIVICGSKAGEFAKTFRNQYIPNVILSYSLTESSLPLFRNRFVNDKTFIYVCRGNVCERPVETLVEAFDLLNLEL